MGFNPRKDWRNGVVASATNEGWQRNSIVADATTNHKPADRGLKPTAKLDRRYATKKGVKMSKMRSTERMREFVMHNSRVVFCVLFVCSVALGLSVWRSEIVSAIDLVAPSAQPVPVATPPEDTQKEFQADGVMAPELVSTGTLTASDATFNRPTNCTTLSGVTTRFDAIPFTVTTAGTKTISFEAADGGSITPTGTGSAGPDTFLVLYNGTFNSGSPLTNCLTLNDDIAAGSIFRSRINTNLVAGAYTAVVTSFRAVPLTQADDNALPWTYSLSITGGVTLTVTKTADTNDGLCDADCSLREAIAAATAGDAIAFSSLFNSGQTITLNGTELLINKNLTINGPGANLLVVSGGNASRVFQVGPGSVVSMSGMTITGGNGNGGGILNNGNLTLTNAVVTVNQAGTTFSGGGIFNNGTLTVTHSTISANTGRGGGGIQNNSVTTVTNSTISGNTANSGAGTSGGIENSGSLTVTNSTISDNRAPNGNINGGGIFSDLSATITITNSTITNNSVAGAGSASGVFRFGGTVNIRNSIIAGNVGNATQPDVVASGGTGITSNGFNLIGNRGTVTFGGTGDQSGTGASPLNPG